MVSLTKIRFEYWGFAGCLTTSLGIFISAIGYTGREGESYSFLNHFISELGELRVSDLAWVFNWGLILGGVFFVGFMWGIKNIIKIKPLCNVLQIVGIYTAVGASLVGVFPMNYLGGHIFAANSFFIGGLILVTLFSIDILLENPPIIPRWFSLVGVGVAAIFTWFLIYLFSATNPDNSTMSFSTVSRPDVWVFPIAEWAVYFAIIIWFLMLAIISLKQSKKNS